jgi:50S ribosomal protein L16 3-hydroxylase
MTQRDTNMQLHNFDTTAFLRDYWQKKPLLIRNPWTSWDNPLEPDELAGLACEDAVESRLIVKARATWKAENGPFPESRFGELAKKPWTLLVQAVDQYVPNVAALIDPFRFIPNWRIDDVMVSYASDGGGVGPHFDQYDVFLIQGLGRRRWQIGGLCDDNTPLLPHDDLRLLAEFEATGEWVLEPGDILYVPPRVAHNGVAVGDDCMTYSIGFRAPSRAELIGHYVDDVLDGLDDDDRYGDPDLSKQSNPGEISADALAKLQGMITERLSDPAAFARWFGRYNSTPKYPDMDWSPDELVTEAELLERLGQGEALLRNPASRFSFIREEGAVLLFTDGECYACEGDAGSFAEILCAHARIAVTAEQAQSDNVRSLITTLFNQGSIAFAEEE